MGTISQVSSSPAKAMAALMSLSVALKSEEVDMVEMKKMWMRCGDEMWMRCGDEMWMRYV